MRRLAFALVVALWAPSPARSETAGENPEWQAAGKAFYGRYCAACHGVDGRGGGPVAPALGQRPPDLTQIARSHGGEFPFPGTAAAIDGTKTVRAHGVSEMPVWGEVFAPQRGWSPDAVAEARGKIVVITEYLRSIQAR